jgi:hypothetical protein
MRIEQITNTEDSEAYVLLPDQDEFATRDVDGHEYVPHTVIVRLEPDEDGVWTDTYVKLLGVDETSGRSVIEYVSQWGDLPDVVRDWLGVTLANANDNR